MPFPEGSNVQDAPAVLHVFQTEAMSTEKSWVPSVHLYKGRCVSLNLTSDRITVLNHHYKHSLLLAWGSDELQKRLKLSDFTGAGDDELVDMYYLVKRIPGKYIPM